MRIAVTVLLLSLLVCGQLSARGRGAGVQADEGSGLVIRGQVTGLEVEKKEGAVLFHVNLNVEFANEGAQPIILLNPTISGGGDGAANRYWLGGWALFATEAGAQGRDAIFADGYWESVSGSDSYRELADSLDVEAPPASHTRTLQPNESWKFSDSFRIYFEAEKHTRWPEHKTWQEMQAHPAQLWLTIDYELSPWNVEYFKPDLIRKLARRWRGFGHVLVERKKESRFNHYKATSEPMPIDFSQAKPKASTAAVEKGP